MSAKRAVFSHRRPLYITLAEQLTSAIRDGEYGVGDLLPSESELTARYGVSRHTVREALREIQSLGMVSSQQGVGTRVRSRAAGLTYQQSFGSIDDLLQIAQQATVVEVNRTSLPAPQELTGPGKFRADQRLLQMEGLRQYPDDPGADPLSWTQIYLIEAYEAALDDSRRKSTSIGQIVEALFDEVITEITQHASAIVLDENTAGTLNAAAGEPAFEIHRWYYGKHGHAFEYTVGIYPADRFSINLRLRRA